MGWSSSTGEPFVYWSFYVLLVLILTYCGWGISNDYEKQPHLDELLSLQIRLV